MCYFENQYEFYLYCFSRYTNLIHIHTYSNTNIYFIPLCIWIIHKYTYAHIHIILAHLWLSPTHTQTHYTEYCVGLIHIYTHIHIILLYLIHKYILLCVWFICTQTHIIHICASYYYLSHKHNLLMYHTLHHIYIHYTTVYLINMHLPTYQHIYIHSIYNSKSCLYSKYIFFKVRNSNVKWIFM